MSLRIRDLIQFFSVSQGHSNTNNLFPNSLCFYGSFWDSLDLKALLQIEGHYSLYHEIKCDGRTKLSYCLDKFFQQREFNIRKIIPTEENTAKLVQHLLFAVLIRNFEEILNISLFPAEDASYLKEQKEPPTKLNVASLQEFIAYLGTLPRVLGILTKTCPIVDRPIYYPLAESSNQKISLLQTVRAVECDDSLRDTDLKVRECTDLQIKLEKASAKNEMGVEIGQLKKRVRVLCEKIDGLEAENSSLRAANYVWENRLASCQREKEQELLKIQQINNELEKSALQTSKKLQESTEKIKNLKKYKQHCYFQSFCIENLKEKLEEFHRTNLILADKLKRYCELEHSIDRLEELEAFYKLYQEKISMGNDSFPQRTPEPKGQNRSLQLSSIPKRDEPAAASKSFVEGIESSMLSSLQSGRKQTLKDKTSRKLLFISTEKKPQKITMLLLLVTLSFFLLFLALAN